MFRNASVFRTLMVALPVAAAFLDAGCSGPGVDEGVGSDPEQLGGICSYGVRRNRYDGPNYWGTVAVKNTSSSSFAGFAVEFDIPSGAHCTNDAVPSGATLWPADRQRNICLHDVEPLRIHLGIVVPRCGSDDNVQLFHYVELVQRCIQCESHLE